MKKIILSFCLLLSWAGAFAQKPIEGDWMGKLNLGPQSLTIVLHVNCNAQEEVKCTLDSPDQGVEREYAGRNRLLLRLILSV